MMRASTGDGVTGNGAIGVLDRITAVFEAFEAIDDDVRGLSISELAARTGLPKSTVSRLVAGLVRQHYLERDGPSIHLGLRLFELAQFAEAPQELRRAALPVMSELRNATGGTVHLAILDGNEMIIVAVAGGGAVASEAPRIGRRIAVSETALGLAVIAHLDPHPAVGVGGLDAHDRAEIVRSGVSITSRGGATDLVSVASPFRSRASSVDAAVSVTVPADGFDVGSTAPIVRAAARSLDRGEPSTRGKAAASDHAVG
jgi:DNA-binding IclR family transcriptional regulator